MTHLVGHCFEPSCKIYNSKHKSLSSCIPELKIDSIQDFQWQYTSAALNIWHDSMSFVVQPALTEVLLCVLLHCNAFSQCVLSKCWQQHISHTWKKCYKCQLVGLYKPLVTSCNVFYAWKLFGAQAKQNSLPPSSQSQFQQESEHQKTLQALPCYFKPGSASNSSVRIRKPVWVNQKKYHHGLQ